MPNTRKGSNVERASSRLNKGGGCPRTYWDTGPALVVNLDIFRGCPPPKDKSHRIRVALGFPARSTFAHGGFDGLFEIFDQLFVRGVHFGVGQGAVSGTIGESVGDALLAGGDVLAAKHVE